MNYFLSFMGNQLDQFLDQKYINLETYKRDGTPIKTPVWFVIDNDLIYVITRDSTGKVKRLRNNHDVRIVSCSFKGCLLYTSDAADE